MALFRKIWSSHKFAPFGYNFAFVQKKKETDTAREGKKWRVEIALQQNGSSPVIAKRDDV